MNTDIEIREIRLNDYQSIGKLMVDIYSNLKGFPSKEEQPGYYEMLSNIGQLNEQKDTKVLVALSPEDKLVGGVVYFSDMAVYGSGGTATTVKNASGIRLLGVDPKFRGSGIGKSLTYACINLAKANGHSQVVLHTTQSMQAAWKLYQKIGFKRSSDLDFLQENLQVFGFILQLQKTKTLNILLTNK